MIASVGMSKGDALGTSSLNVARTPDGGEEGIALSKI